MTTKTTADEARDLLSGTTPGPWAYTAACEEVPARITQAHDPTEDVAIIGDVLDADGRLMAAAPDLARTVIAQVVEVAAMREIIAGRASAPTEREFGAAWAWLHCDGHHRFHVTSDYGDVAYLYGGRWWPLDGDGRPCAWPVVP